LLSPVLEFDKGTFYLSIISKTRSRKKPGISTGRMLRCCMLSLTLQGVKQRMNIESEPIFNSDMGASFLASWALTIPSYLIEEAFLNDHRGGFWIAF
jgi:hypothetical protein